MTSKGVCMSVEQRFTQYVLCELAVLVNEHEFRPPTISVDWITRIDFLRDSIAIEVEIDWRELDVFFLVVRLEDGRLPEGYYVSRGRRSRVHLLNLIVERKWAVDHELVSRIRMRNKVDPRKRDIECLKAQVLDQRALLLSCIDQILAENVGLFDPSPLQG